MQVVCTSVLMPNFCAVPFLTSPPPLSHRGEWPVPNYHYHQDSAVALQGEEKLAVRGEQEQLNMCPRGPCDSLLK